MSRQPDNDYLLVSMLFTLAYVFDEVLNWLIGPNIGGALVLSGYALVLSIQGAGDVRFNTRHFLAYLAVVAASTMAFVSPSGCFAEAKGVISLLFLGVLVILFSRINMARIVTNRRITDAVFWFVLFLLVGDLIGVGVEQIFGHARGSAAYQEPSHLAVYLLPLIAVRLLSSPRDMLAWLTLFASVIMEFSSTLLVGLAGIFVLSAWSAAGAFSWRVWGPVLVASLGLVAIFTGVVDASYTAERVMHVLAGFDVEGASQINLSSMVWLNGWSQAVQTAGETYGLGTGFNQMGCGRFYMMGVFSEFMEQAMGTVLNSSDGSFLTSKLVAELGWLGGGVVLVLSWLAIKSIFELRGRALNEHADDRLVAIIRAAGGLSVLMYLYVRGLGYFHLPTLLSISMLFMPRDGVKLASGGATGTG